MYHIKNDKRTHKTTQLISDALSSLILENQWESLTITALVNKAQVGRATFYRSFDCVEDVLKYQIDKTMDELFQALYNELHKLDYFYELDIYKLFFSYWNHHDMLLNVLIKSNQKTLFNESFNNFYNEKLSFVKPLLGIQDLHWSYFVILRSAIFTNGLFAWIEKGKKESPEGISKILLLSFSELHMVKLSCKNS